jgi:hypothetical protein
MNRFSNGFLSIIGVNTQQALNIMDEPRGVLDFTYNTVILQTIE